jgi:hypothetical protein
MPAASCRWGTTQAAAFRRSLRGKGPGCKHHLRNQRGKACPWARSCRSHRCRSRSVDRCGARSHRCRSHWAERYRSPQRKDPSCKRHSHTCTGSSAMCSCTCRPSNSRSCRRLGSAYHPGRRSPMANCMLLRHKGLHRRRHPYSQTRRQCPSTCNCTPRQRTPQQHRRSVACSCRDMKRLEACRRSRQRRGPSRPRRSRPCPRLCRFGFHRCSRRTVRRRPCRTSRRRSSRRPIHPGRPCRRSTRTIPRSRHQGRQFRLRSCRRAC